MIGKFSLLNKLTFSTLGNCFASLSFPSWSYPNWYPQSSSHCFAISDSFLTCSCQIFVWIYLFENFLVSYSGAHLGVILNTSLTLSNILPSEFVKSVELDYLTKESSQLKIKFREFDNWVSMMLHCLLRLFWHLE